MPPYKTFIARVATDFIAPIGHREYRFEAFSLDHARQIARRDFGPLLTNVEKA